MDLPLWTRLLNEAVYWQNIDDIHALQMYQSVVVAWGMSDTRLYAQGPERVDLTKVYEQYKLLATIKGTHGAQQE